MMFSLINYGIIIVITSTELTDLNSHCDRIIELIIGKALILFPESRFELGTYLAENAGALELLSYATP
jgi:hypothetical protein